VKVPSLFSCQAHAAPMVAMAPESQIPRLRSLIRVKIEVLDKPAQASRRLCQFSRSEPTFVLGSLVELAG
jgi:hypothetical protein